MEHTINRYIGHEKNNYTNVLDRKTTSTIFKTRTRMIDVKANYKNKYKDQTCRLCKKENETQQHILTECEITRKNNLTIDYDMLSAHSHIITKSVARKIEKILEMLSNSKLSNDKIPGSNNNTEQKTKPKTPNSKSDKPPKAE